jgi:phosphoenolpyruvate synthase/pyruvate phosphate dikinase
MIDITPRPDFVKIAERKHSPLNLNWIASGQTSLCSKKVLGYDLGYTFYLYIDGEIFVTKDTIEDLEGRLDTILGIENLDVVPLQKLFGLWKSLGEALVREAEAIQEAPPNSNKTLAQTFKNITEKYDALSTSLTVVLQIEKNIEKALRKLLLQKGRTDIEAELYLLTTPRFKNENEEETEELDAICHIFATAGIRPPESTQEIDARIESHRREYGWLNNARYLGETWTKEDLLQRIIERIEKPVARSISANDQSQENLEKALLLTDQEQLLVDIARDYVYLRTFRMNCFMKAGYLLHSFLEDCASRLGIPYTDFIHMVPPEIVACLEGAIEIPQQLIEERKKAYAFIIDKSFVRNFSGRELDAFRDKYFKHTYEQETSSFTGTIAYKGFVKGIARIVKDMSDLAKVKRGDVLVAPMTIPNFIPAMERASAFVTDEGGILCHAAIVSREMRKPCIIGTKIATKVLKDGDVVEVDANTGVVRKL